MKAERGQAYTEYVIVLMMVAMALLARDPSSGEPYVGKLLSAIKQYYQGYTTAVSLPELPSDK